MHLSLLSEGSLSDRFDDAGIVEIPAASSVAPLHFAAVCRGLIVVAALTLPIALTLFAQAPASGAVLDNTIFASTGTAQNKHGSYR